MDQMDSFIDLLASKTLYTQRLQALSSLQGHVQAVNIKDPVPNLVHDSLVPRYVSVERSDTEAFSSAHCTNQPTVSSCLQPNLQPSFPAHNTNLPNVSSAYYSNLQSTNTNHGSNLQTSSTQNSGCVSLTDGSHLNPLYSDSTNLQQSSSHCKDQVPVCRVQPQPVDSGSHPPSYCSSTVSQHGQMVNVLKQLHWMPPDKVNSQFQHEVCKESAYSKRHVGNERDVNDGRGSSHLGLDLTRGDRCVSANEVSGDVGCISKNIGFRQLPPGPITSDHQLSNVSSYFVDQISSDKDVSQKSGSQYSAANKSFHESSNCTTHKEDHIPKHTISSYTVSNLLQNDGHCHTCKDARTSYSQAYIGERTSDPQPSMDARTSYSSMDARTCYMTELNSNNTEIVDSQRNTSYFDKQLVGSDNRQNSNAKECLDSVTDFSNKSSKQVDSSHHTKNLVGKDMPVSNGSDKNNSHLISKDNAPLNSLLSSFTTASVQQNDQIIIKPVQKKQSQNMVEPVFSRFSVSNMLSSGNVQQEKQVPKTSASTITDTRRNVPQPKHGKVLEDNPEKHTGVYRPRPIITYPSILTKGKMVPPNVTKNVIERPAHLQGSLSHIIGIDPKMTMRQIIQNTAAGQYQRRVLNQNFVLSPGPESYPAAVLLRPSQIPDPLYPSIPQFEKQSNTKALENHSSATLAPQTSLHRGLPDKEITGGHFVSSVVTADFMSPTIAIALHEPEFRCLADRGSFTGSHLTGLVNVRPTETLAMHELQSSVQRNLSQKESENGTLRLINTDSIRPSTVVTQEPQLLLPLSRMDNSGPFLTRLTPRSFENEQILSPPYRPFSVSSFMSFDPHSEQLPQVTYNDLQMSIFGERLDPILEQFFSEHSSDASKVHSLVTPGHKTNTKSVANNRNVLTKPGDHSNSSVDNDMHVVHDMLDVSSLSVRSASNMENESTTDQCFERPDGCTGNVNSSTDQSLERTDRGSVAMTSTTGQCFERTDQCLERTDRCTVATTSSSDQCLDKTDQCLQRTDICTVDTTSSSDHCLDRTDLCLERTVRCLGRTDTSRVATTSSSDQCLDRTDLCLERTDRCTVATTSSSDQCLDRTDQYLERTDRCLERTDTSRVVMTSSSDQCHERTDQCLQRADRCTVAMTEQNNVSLSTYSKSVSGFAGDELKEAHKRTEDSNNAINKMTSINQSTKSICNDDNNVVDSGFCSSVAESTNKSDVTILYQVIMNRRLSVHDDPEIQMTTLNSDVSSTATPEINHTSLRSGPTANEAPEIQSYLEADGSIKFQETISLKSLMSSDCKKAVYRCRLCPKSFENISYLKDHEMLHSSGKLYKCTECPKCYKDSSSLNRHARVHSGKRNHKCAVCGKAFLDSYALESHVRVHTKEKSHLCSVCGKSFSHANELQVHKYSHSGFRPYVCRKCGKGFSKSSKLQVHNRSHTGEKPFTCQYCSKAFAVSSNLRVHLRTHTGPASYRCETCKQVFSENEELINHMKIHSDFISYNCHLCPRKFVELSRLEEHKSIHTGEKCVQCLVCKKTFKKVHKLIFHQAKMHGEKKTFSCNVCHKTFTTSNDLSRHIETHSQTSSSNTDIATSLTSMSSRISESKRQHLCEICEKTFVRFLDLKEHLNTHTGQKPNKCLSCGQGFCSRGGLRKHVRKYHKENNPSVDNKITGQCRNICELCGKTFKQLCHLKVHKRIHFGEKPYFCEVCGKRFRDTGVRNRHVRTHTGERPHQCKVCSKSFVDSGSLQKHHAVHTKPKNHICKTCGKGFNFQGDLQVHTRSHSGDKPFKCETCGKGFAKSSKLVIHKRTHSGEKPYKCTICNRAFSVSSNLRAHTKTHATLTTYSCSTCSRIFYCSEKLDHHVREAHSSMSLLACPQCDKTFAEEHRLREHLFTHSKIKPFQCSQCEKSFVRLLNLQQHQSSHSTTKTHLCHKCNSSFHTHSNLQRHMHSHSNDSSPLCEQCAIYFPTSKELHQHFCSVHAEAKQFKCQRCSKGFRRRGELNVHMSTHTGQRPFKCNICNKGFCGKSGLRKHTVMNHSR